MLHDVVDDVAYARQALILAGKRLDRVEAALTANPPPEPAKPKRRKSRRAKTTQSGEESANA